MMKTLLTASLLLTVATSSFAARLYPRLLDTERKDYKEAKQVINELGDVDYKNITIDQYASQTRRDCEEVFERYRSYATGRIDINYADYLEDACVRAEENILKEASVKEVVNKQITEIKKRYKAKKVTMKYTRDYTREVVDTHRDGLSTYDLAANAVVYPFAILGDVLLLPFAASTDIINSLFGHRKIHLFVDDTELPYEVIRFN